MIALDDGSVVDAVIGYRAWHFDAVAGRARIRSLHVDSVYWTDEVMKAVCLCPAKAGERLDTGRCRGTCGLYAWKSCPRTMLAAASKVWGEVYMWGDVSIREKAIVAEYARVAGFYPIGYRRQRILVETLAHQFGVPLLGIPEGTRQVYAHITEAHRTTARFRAIIEGAT